MKRSDFDEDFNVQREKDYEKTIEVDLYETLLNKLQGKSDINSYSKHEKSYLIKTFMAYITSNMQVCDKVLLKNALEQINLVNNFEQNQFGYSFDDNEGNRIFFRPLSSLKEIFFEYPELLDFNERLGACHIHSIEIALLLGGNSTKVQTGYIQTLSEKFDFLHSWVEFKVGDEDFVADFNLNLIISKNNYYKIVHAQPLAVLNIETIKHDYLSNLLFEISSLPETKEYMLFRDDFVKKLEERKNSSGQSQPQ